MSTFLVYIQFVSGSSSRPSNPTPRRRDDYEVTPDDGMNRSYTIKGMDSQPFVPGNNSIPSNPDPGIRENSETLFGENTEQAFHNAEDMSSYHMQNGNYNPEYVDNTNYEQMSSVHNVNEEVHNANVDNLNNIKPKKTMFKDIGAGRLSNPTPRGR